MPETEEKGLINYFTKVIIRPHREQYPIEKLGSSKMVVRSQEENLAIVQQNKDSRGSEKKNTKGCQLIEVTRKDVTVEVQGKKVEVSIFEPQLKNQSQNSTLDRDSSKSKSKNAHSHTSTTITTSNCHQGLHSECVVFLHANSGSRLQSTDYVKFILQYRTMCVCFDYRGSGVSQGEYTTMGVSESKDLSYVLRYVSRQYGIRKFGLWGRSMGAVTGIYYLISHYQLDHKLFQVTSCVLDSPFSSLEKLILQLASRRSTLPQFLFEPILKMIEKDITNKVGCNIFQNLNLICQLQQLPEKSRQLISSVNFLGIASKDDKMIAYSHTESLCDKISEVQGRIFGGKSSANVQVSSPDLHLKNLYQFEGTLNTKGDLLYIQGDHNKPRSNEIKQKVSFFIHSSFFNQRGNLTPNKLNEKQAVLNFNTTGKQIKTKLSFTKAKKQTHFDQKLSNREPSNQVKQSSKNSQILSKGSHNGTSYKNSTTKKANTKNCSQQKISFKDLSAKINSKQTQSSAKNQKEVSNIFLAPSKSPKKVEERISPQHQKQHGKAKTESLLSKLMGVHKKSQQLESPRQFMDLSPRMLNLSKNSKNSIDSVNNSANRSDQLTPELNSNGSKNSNPHSAVKLKLSQNTQVFHSESLTDRNCMNHAQNRYKPKKYQQLKEENLHSRPNYIETNEFDVSIDKSFNNSREYCESIQEQSFRKKESSTVEYGSVNAAGGQTPQSHCKLSISDFTKMNKEQLDSKNTLRSKKKENNFASANINNLKQRENEESQKASQNSFNNSLASRTERQQTNQRIQDPQSSPQQPQNSSVEYQAPRVKQMMMKGGHPGMSQSSTFYMTPQIDEFSSSVNHSTELSRDRKAVGRSYIENPTFYSYCEPLSQQNHTQVAFNPHSYQHAPIEQQYSQPGTHGFYPIQATSQSFSHSDSQQYQPVTSMPFQQPMMSLPPESPHKRMIPQNSINQNVHYRGVVSHQQSGFGSYGNCAQKQVSDGNQKQVLHYKNKITRLLD